MIRIGIENGIAIPPLAGIIDLNRNSGEGFDHELAGESSVPTGATGCDIDFLQGLELGIAHLHFIEKYLPRILRDAAKCGVPDGAGLLIDFLEHEVLEPALFRHNRIPGDALSFTLHHVAVKIGDAHTFLSDNGEIAIGEEEQVAGVVEQRGHVAGNEELILA